MEQEKRKIPVDGTPAIYRASDAASLRGQRLFLRATGVRLALLVLAASAAVGAWRIGSIDVLAILSAVAFGAALVLELYTATARPEQSWYEGRAAAESAKTLMWRYMVGGAGFEIKMKADNTWAERRLLQRFQEISQDLPQLQLTPQIGSIEQVTDYMRQIRALTLNERRRFYVAGRLDDQISWYAKKSRSNQKRATVWISAVLSLELVGLIAAIFKVSGLLSIDLMGVASAVAAGCIAWGQAKQFRTLAAAYAVTHYELTIIRAAAADADTEDEWKRYVATAEDAISREHTLWRASRPFS
ncbi:DUF4231 domain-containing protein [Nonomuraea bangladeshensis]|uniref:DUF4231 domain-containing protein n=1 Tax=Nonomuraea bangladeshensis TaxID=404385 RepID=UPI0031CE375F